jgi:hypothetical protein
MTANTSIDPAEFLHAQLAAASPDLLRDMLSTFIQALMSAEADAVSGDAGSITNMAEYAAEFVRQTFLATDPEPPLWIQRLVYEDSPPSTMFVTLTSSCRRESGVHALTPSWEGLSSEDLEELIGPDPDLGRGERYVPQPQPERKQIRYEVVAVDQLLMAHPFRQPECMGDDDLPGPRWKRGRQGFLLRRLLRQHCWYHQGDWKAVNRLAEIHLRTAIDSGTVDVKTAVREAIDAAEYDDWTAEALDSLFAIPIDLNQTSHPWTFMNGQHRVQAMRDARVARTIIAQFD